MKTAHRFPNRTARRIGDALMLLMKHEEIDFDDLQIVLSHVLDQWDQSPKRELPVIGEIPEFDLFEFWAENKTIIYPDGNHEG